MRLPVPGQVTTSVGDRTVTRTVACDCGGRSYATCDTTVSHDPFRVCGAVMCQACIGSQPADDFHRCKSCAKARGEAK